MRSLCSPARSRSRTASHVAAAPFGGGEQHGHDNLAMRKRDGTHEGDGSVSPLVRLVFGKEIAQPYAKGLGDVLQRIEGWELFASLDHADVVGGDPGLLRELSLGQAD